MMSRLYSNLIIAFIAFSYQCNAQNFKRDNSGVIYKNFVTNPFHRLMNSLILTTLEVSSPRECAFHCLDNQRCYSMNFGETYTAHGKHTCELLNADMFVQQDSFVVSREFHHYNIKTPCMEHPCQNGGTCFPVYDEDDYSCACAPGYIGRHCETGQIVICEGKTGQLRCSDGGMIQVLSANYGRLDAHTCPLASHDSAYYNTNCRAGNSLARVQETCQNNAHCKLQARNSLFGDPCRNTPKYLLVKYRCQI